MSAPKPIDVLRAYEAWEADLLLSAEAWGGGFPGGMREAFVELDIRIPPTLDAEIKRARETLSRAVPVSTGSPQALSTLSTETGEKAK